MGKTEVLADIGYMPSEANFYHGMKVREVVKYSAELRKRDCAKEAARLCERLELDVNKKNIRAFAWQPKKGFNSLRLAAQAAAVYS